MIGSSNFFFKSIQLRIEWKVLLRSLGFYPFYWILCKLEKSRKRLLNLTFHPLPHGGRDALCWSSVLVLSYSFGLEHWSRMSFYLHLVSSCKFQAVFFTESSYYPTLIVICICTHCHLMHAALEGKTMTSADMLPGMFTVVTRTRERPSNNMIEVSAMM